MAAVAIHLHRRPVPRRDEHELAVLGEPVRAVGQGEASEVPPGRAVVVLDVERKRRRPRRGVRPAGAQERQPQADLGTGMGERLLRRDVEGGEGGRLCAERREAAVHVRREAGGKQGLGHDAGAGEGGAHPQVVERRHPRGIGPERRERVGPAGAAQIPPRREPGERPGELHPAVLHVDDDRPVGAIDGHLVPGAQVAGAVDLDPRPSAARGHGEDLDGDRRRRRPGAESSGSRDRPGRRARRRARRPCAAGSTRSVSVARSSRRGPAAAASPRCSGTPR